MRPLFILLLLLLLLSGCAVPFLRSPTPIAEPTAMPEPTATPLPRLTDPLTVSELGLMLSLPTGWVSELRAGTLKLAPSEAALNLGSPGADIVFTLDITPLSTLVVQLGEEAASDPEPFFTLSSSSMEEANYSLSPTTTLLLDGYAGLASDLSGPGVAGRLVVILGPEVALRVLGQATTEAWQAQEPLYTALLESLRFVPLPTPTPTATPVHQASQPLIVDVGPPGFVLRLGGRAGPPDGRFVAARGLAVAPDGTLYLAESRRGVWVFEPDGALLMSFGADDLLDAYDVARSPTGEIFVADFGRNAIAHFSADGTFIKRWGSAGDGLAQFGLASPQRIAIGPNETIYALDARPSSEGERGVVSSVVRFSTAGELLERIALPDDLAPADLVVAPDGALFLAETFGGVVKLAPDGSELARLGDPTELQDLAAAAIDLDAQGNIYLATYSAGIVKLNPNGQIIARGGSATPPGNLPGPGEFSLPNGIVVAPGDLVWVSDNSGEYSAISALRLQSVAEVGDAEAESEATTSVEAAEEATPTPTIVAASLLRQWASEANASSFYAPDYPPSNATGPPSVAGCQDSPNAWAAAEPNSLEILELRYATPVFAVGVIVHQSYNPGFISQIELFDERGNASIIYTAEPALSEECPQLLEVTFAQTLNRIVAVRLTIDQRPGANWSEIDAVELLGLP